MTVWWAAVGATPRWAVRSTVRRRRRRDRQPTVVAPRDSGGATALLLASLGALVLGLAVVQVGVGAAVAHGRADSAADLAALAGAGRLVTGAGVPASCAHATAVAADNGATVTGCVARTGSLLVTVGVDVVVLGVPARVTSVARAGPQEP